MKKIIANVASLMVIVAVFAVAGFAQTVKADIPFEFSVGHKTFPAGEYWVTQIAPHTLAVRDSNNSLVAVTLTQPMRSLSMATNSKLRFEVRDGRSALSEIWTDGATGYKLSVPKYVGLAQNRPGVQATTSSYTGK